MWIIYRVVMDLLFDHYFSETQSTNVKNVKSTKCSTESFL